MFDGAGLFLLISPAGGKLWRLKYRFGGREKLLALGSYPQISLADARQRRDEAKAMIAKGVDPGAARQAQKEAQSQAAETFEVVAREWLAKKSSGWVASHTDTIRARLKKYIFPYIGSRPTAEIRPPELLTVLRRIESKGTIETAHRVKQICGQVFRYAVVTGRAESDPSASLRGALESAKVKHMAAITDRKQAGGLLRAIEDYQGSFVVKCALRLAPLLFVRPGELRHMEWAEIDFESATWLIPAEKMKMRRSHGVPLATQSLAILKEVRPLTGDGRYVFPSARSNERPMSDMALLAALRRMGFTKEEATTHGFRSMASSLLHEAGWDSSLIELQLAHRDRNVVRGIYNRADRIEERRKMMMFWADYLDELKNE